MNVHSSVHPQNHLTLQGELEHCVGKNWFSCTSRKGFILQLVSIEQCQACICCIRSKVAALPAGPKERLPNKPKDHYHIGQTQAFPEDLMLFVRKNLDDPLMKVHRIQVIFPLNHLIGSYCLVLLALHSPAQDSSATSCPSAP